MNGVEVLHSTHVAWSYCILLHVQLQLFLHQVCLHYFGFPFIIFSQKIMKYSDSVMSYIVGTFKNLWSITQCFLEILNQKGYIQMVLIWYTKYEYTKKKVIKQTVLGIFYWLFLFLSYTKRIDTTMTHELALYDCENTSIT